VRNDSVPAVFDRNDGLMNKTFFLIFGLAGLIGISGFVIDGWQKREAKMTASCLNNLRQLDGGKQQWALENKKGPNDEPTWERDLVVYFKCGPNGPECPKGGVYVMGRVADPPSCSIPKHQQTFLKIMGLWPIPTNNQPSTSSAVP
jgi:hypothetical protein